MWYKNAADFKSTNGYEIKGVWYPRVTRILEVKAKPALEQFLKEMGSFSSAEEVKNKSAAEGSLIHEVIEKQAVGQAVDIPPEIQPAIEAFQRFREERKAIFYPEFIERQLWSPRYRYAGTFDALASIDGKFGVLDIKTSNGFYPEYNLQTAAYTAALREFEVKKSLALPHEIETRWILRVTQRRICGRCGATLREKGGRSTIRSGKGNRASCPEARHEWGDLRGEAELREFPQLLHDLKAFVAAKILWEWDNEYWLRQIKYST